MKLCIGSSLVGFLLCAPASAQVTQRVSLTSLGVQANGFSGFPAISADGRYVAFHSGATNLVPGDTNDWRDTFVRDRQGGTTERVSIGSGGAQGNQESDTASPSISADGRYVAFASAASNLVAGDTNLWGDVFVRDRQLAVTERVSVATGGTQADGFCSRPSISADGRYVAFTSTATNLVPGDTNGRVDVFVRDRQASTTERVSVDSSGAQSNDNCFHPSVSADGRYVAFHSAATNLVVGDTNGTDDIFLRDRVSATTERVSVSSGGSQGNGPSYDASISGDGRCVAFYGTATNLVVGDTNRTYDVFVRDRQTGSTERVSVASGGGQASDVSASCAISADGRYVAFWSIAANLVVGDTNEVSDIFLHDRALVATGRQSVDSWGVEAGYVSSDPTISGDGRRVAFQSLATNLVQADTNAAGDIFLRDREEGPNFASICTPGASGVIACPCANPPSELGRGCNNSSSTGGAGLAAGGGTYLSSDSLVFTTSGEKPTALSIVSQWTGANPTGVVFGMGVRCTSGSMKRLYTKSAVGGSITAPEFGAGDPQVSARSAALGDTIQPGQSRWYLVYYRDPILLGGCPATSTFNATQTGQVTWSP
jgi:Tol biopolymer transport system component